ncbi:putative malate dehydrogenase protein [Eutypa lata UCREL1]|uniref:Putative malate dehydrogenase protein n=1 Tax=Eutypa lata (strain UCR-EL1) TaxID=1287681 RepID=M7TZZ8_EUTLA|nr:putative malate dehydrogenase protein [Eutypa lata UCREL1]
MLPSSFLVFLSAAVLTSAHPLYPLRKRCSNETLPATPDIPSTVTPVLPVNGGSTELQGPDNTTTLKHILVGHGIQNYTCASAGAPATSTGALAVVWDIEPLYPGTSASSLSAADWAALTPKVLRTTDMPLNLAPTGSSSSSEYAADPSAPFPPDADLALEGVNGTLKFLGHHYFDATGTPTFDLHGDAAKPVFKGKKDDGIKAPADADPGLTDSGAVDWLRLSDKGTSTGGLSLVFRVYTAGGNAAPCTEAGQTDSVPYTAMYWVY